MRIDKTANKKTKERGSALMEMTVIIPLCGIILSGILTFGAFIHISFATRQSAFDCAMMAAQSLSTKQGQIQGVESGKMAFNSFGMGSGGSNVALTGKWDRNGAVECAVTYAIPVGNMPVKVIAPIPSSYTYTVILPVQVWKSEWERDKWDKP